jgi:hypothetical protein
VLRLNFPDLFYRSGDFSESDITFTVSGYQRARGLHSPSNNPIHNISPCLYAED